VHKTFATNKVQDKQVVRVVTHYAPTRCTAVAAARTLQHICSPSLTPTAPSAPCFNSCGHH